MYFFYRSDDHKITLGSRYSVSSELDELLFMVHKRSKNGSRIYGEAIREGMTPVYGSFKDVSLNNLYIVINLI